MATRPMVPADITRIVVAEELDAGGGTVVVGRRIIRRGRYVSHLYLAEPAATERWRTRRLTDGRVRDTTPRVAPDGSAVAFLRRNPDDDDAPPTLNAVTIRTGRVRRWAPRGARPGFGGDRRDRLVAGRAEPRVHRRGRSAAVHRRRTAAGRLDRVTVGQAAVAGGPADRPVRLAVGRGRPPRPLVAPVRARPPRRAQPRGR